MNPINALMGADGQRPQLLKLDFFRPHPIIATSNSMSLILNELFLVSLF